ncbi:MAG TPA: ATPase [Candidatus Acetothermia bacterium]|nr:ATPase [Candidatus Acetothermia bacterium]
MRERRGIVGHETDNPYYEGKKYPEPTVCERCGLFYRDGHWQHPPEDLPRDAHRALCPACRREHDRYPGGLLYLGGSYLAEKRDEILNLVRNQEEEARRQRPLQRVLWIKDEGDEVEIATTTPHLAMRIGRAIHSAHKGDLEIKPLEDEYMVRLFWRRDLKEA